MARAAKGKKSVELTFTKLAMLAVAAKGGFGKAEAQTATSKVGSGTEATACDRNKIVHFPNSCL